MAPTMPAEEQSSTQKPVKTGRVMKSGSGGHKCDHPGCDKSFVNREHLTRHKVEHLPPSLFCPRCSAGFHRRDQYRLHLKRHEARDEAAGGEGKGKLGTRKKLWRDENGNLRTDKRPADLEEKTMQRSRGSQGATQPVAPAAGSLANNAFLAQPWPEAPLAPNVNEPVLEPYWPAPAQGLPTFSPSPRGSIDEPDPNTPPQVEGNHESYGYHLMPEEWKAFEEGEDWNRVYGAADDFDFDSYL